VTGQGSPRNPIFLELVGGLSKAKAIACSNFKIVARLFASRTGEQAMARLHLANRRSKELLLVIQTDCSRSSLMTQGSNFLHGCSNNQPLSAGLSKLIFCFVKA
jgi:hypothetical protein